MGDLRGIRMTFDLPFTALVKWRGEPGRAWTFEIACSYLNGWESLMTDQKVLMTQFLNALATRAEATKSAVVAIRPANGRQAVSCQYKALIMPRAASGAKRPFVE
jgi:hypothetical protein